MFFFIESLISFQEIHVNNQNPKIRQKKLKTTSKIKKSKK